MEIEHSLQIHKSMKLFIFVDDIDGHEKIWIIGDAFVRKSYAQAFFLSSDQEYYMKKYFDVQSFTSDADINILARLHNAVVCAINKETLLLKYMMMVIDVDIIREMNFNDYGVSILLGKWLHWLANEIHRLLLAYKETLPDKAKKFCYPRILWFACPTHINFSNNDIWKNLMKLYTP